ncbi:MAG: helix-turn-helix domain-containing protein [Thermoanaerobaculum sp.]|nr:helix-turn-helix domain-containing protein [Thermoanaerobaculum sp.]MDW7966814.1 helix-turn-helix transcriptional regulator [Thermoanaerobaculum sp.]
MSWGADAPKSKTLGRQEAARVGELIRLERQRRRVTQVELARQIGISQSDLSRIEKGEYRVPLDVLFRILRVFEMSFSEFFGDLRQGPLTKEERALLESFRKLSPEAKGEVLEFVAFKLAREGQ